MKFFPQILTFTFLIIVPLKLFSQDTETDKRKHQENIDKQTRTIYDSIPKLNPVNAKADTPIVQITQKSQFPKLSNQEKKERKKEAERINAARAPHPDDLAKYREFLKQKNTGLIKLFPDLGCGSQFVVKVDGNCANAIQDSAAYSFQKRLYFDGIFHDLRLENQRLFFDGFLSQAIVTDLGDVAIGNISLNNDYAKTLISFKPQTKSADAKTQFWEISRKFIGNGLVYGKVILANVNSTYLARIINYRLNETNGINGNPKNQEDLKFLSVWYDKVRFDTIVAFRIVRIDVDGSISILWKELVKIESPKLLFEKDEKLTDLKEK